MDFCNWLRVEAIDFLSFRFPSLWRQKF